MCRATTDKGEGRFCFIIYFVAHSRNSTSPQFPSENGTEFPIWKDKFLLQVPGLSFCLFPFNQTAYFEERIPLSLLPKLRNLR